MKLSRRGFTFPRSIYWEGQTDDGLAAPDRVKWSRDAALCHRFGSLVRIVHEGGLLAR